MKKKALGKGLNALIKEVPEELITDEDRNNILDIPLDQIKPNPFQPRKTFHSESLQELALSIKENGIIQPVLVRKKDSYYELIAGERRYRASEIAEMESIPCIVKDFEDIKLLELALIENLQREDLNAIEIAISYQELMHQLELTQEELSKKVGKNRATVANTLRLLKLPEKIKQDVIQSLLSEGHARAMLPIEDIDKILAVRNEIIENNLSVRQTEMLVKKILEENKSKPAVKKDVRAEIRDIEEKLTEIVGTKIKIHDKGNKGKIEIEYYSLEDFEKIKSILEASPYYQYHKI
ncbi:MAG TPA: chromosome partitioning protein ParB [Spirochaetia bacterium]|nr:MAG: hypothetical protein A2Y41_04105 [Spirochaetes bacterium GWB1_36_13]HCL57836.1 chromosome partitioning protein ParB [Spirochaetia bacterium]